MQHEAAVFMQVKEDTIQVQSMQSFCEMECHNDTAAGFSLEGLFG